MFLLKVLKMARTHYLHQFLSSMCGKFNIDLDTSSNMLLSMLTLEWYFPFVKELRIALVGLISLINPELTGA